MRKNQIIILCVSCFLLLAATEAKRVKGQVKTIYDITGRVVNQSEDAKGFHRVFGFTKLVAGLDTVNLNTTIVNGLQDVSFISVSTYWGRAWSLDPANDSTYKVIPLSGSRFIVKSSGETDTATINFVVEGE